MTRTLPKDDSGTDFIQFRGYQTSVTIDDFGLRFTTRQQSTPDEHADIRMHEPLPVADRDDLLDPDTDTDTPDNAIPTEIAEAITNGDFANALVCWGVVCEWPLTDEDGALTGGVCGETFDTPRSLNGHLRVHYDGDVDIEEEEDDVAESDERDVVTSVANDETAIADAVADESNTTSDADESDESSDTDRNSDSNTEDN